MKTTTTAQTLSTYAVVEAIRVQFTAAIKRDDATAMNALFVVMSTLVGIEQASFHTGTWCTGAR